MPLGPYSSFSECVGAQKRKGKSDESARKICGAMQTRIEGGSSSQKQRSASQGAMSSSFPPSQSQQEKKPEQESETEAIKLSVAEAEEIVSLLVNLKEAIGTQSPELTQQIDKSIMIFEGKANISE